MGNTNNSFFGGLHLKHQFDKVFNRNFDFYSLAGMLDWYNDLIFKNESIKNIAVL